MRLPTLAAVLVAFALPACAEDLQFTLINNSSHDISEMYLSPHEKDSWGENILNVDVVAAGTQGKITITDGESVCDYDMRFVTTDGAEVEDTQDMCKLGSYTLHD
ncbi:hypothetical protein GC209_09015 [bacterium]|nr:hypothetical protein [bacterium]